MCSELVGHKLSSVISMSAFTLLTLGSAFVKPFYGLVICRGLAGIFASPALDISLMMLFEMWPSEMRTIPFAVYSVVSFLGLFLGPVIGVYIVHTGNWSWTQYMVLLIFAGCVPLVVWERETHKNTLLRRQKSSKTTKRPSLRLPKDLSRSFLMLFTKPRAFLFSLHSGSSFATFYAIFTVFPQIFAKTYSATLTFEALSLIGMMIGVVIGLVILIMNGSLSGGVRKGKLVQEGGSDLEKSDAAKVHEQRNSRLSFTPSRGNASILSRNGLSRKGSRSSLPLIRGSVGLNSSAQDPGRNIDLAVAATNYLNGVPENETKRIMPERILLILDKKPTFSDICSQLEAYELRLDRVELAKILVDTDDRMSVHGSLLLRSKSLHRDAAAAAIEIPAPPPAVTLSSTPAGPSKDYVWPLTVNSSQVLIAPRTRPVSQRKPQRPPRKFSSTQQHLRIAVLGSVLTTGSLFMLGWTAELPLPYLLPTVATGIFACGALLTFASGIEYLMAFYGPKDGENAVAGSTVLRYILSAVFPIFAIHLFEGLDVAWSSSVLGLISAALGLVPVIFLVFDNSSKKIGRRENVS